MTITVCCAPTVVGAVYSPDTLIVPVPTGLIVQVTAVLLVLATLAANCCVWPPLSVAVRGVTLIVTGELFTISVTVAVAVL